MKTDPEAVVLQSVQIPGTKFEKIASLNLTKQEKTCIIIQVSYIKEKNSVCAAVAE